MRTKDKVILWPVYFDSTKTRKEGRRVPKKFATPKPELEKIGKTVGQLGYIHKVISEARHPNAPWRNTGLISVSKRKPKNQIIRIVSRELLRIRT